MSADATPPRGPGRKRAAQEAADKPPTLAVHAEKLPASLTARPLWVCWKWIRKGGRWTKPPVSAATLRPCDVTDPGVLASADAALAHVAAGRADGVGVVLHAAGLLGIDLDDCRDPDAGTVAPWALEIVAALASYAEASPSGTGVKVLVVATKPGPRCRAGDVELYDAGRYFTLTGHTLADTPAEPQVRQAEVDALYARLFPPADAPRPPTAGPTPPPRGPADTGDPSADDRLEAAFRSKTGPGIRRLWDGDTTGYGSASEADLALCSKLGFYFPDPAELAAVFARSSLYRAKWDRADYRDQTVAKALAGRTEFYDPGRRRGPGGPDGGRPPTGAGGDARPEIVIGCDQGRVNDEAAAALGRAADVYHRGGQLVQVIEQPADSPDTADIRRPAGADLIRELPLPTLQDRLSRVAEWTRVVPARRATSTSRPTPRRGPWPPSTPAATGKPSAGWPGW